MTTPSNTVSKKINRDDFFHLLQTSLINNIKQLPQIIHDNIKYLTGGKKLRSTLMYDCADIINLDYQQIVDPAVYIELLHTISLLHDDVIDDTHERRSHPTLNNTYPNPTPIFAGNFLLFQLLDFFSKYPNPSLRAILIKKILELFSGEYIQDYQLTIDDSPETYLNIVKKKTGSLFSLSFYIPAFLKDYPKPILNLFEECGYLYGMAYQLIDDFNDLTEDIKEEFGKTQITLPLYFLKQNNPAKYEELLTSSKKSGQQADKKAFDITLDDLDAEDKKTIKSEISKYLYQSIVKLKASPVLKDLQSTETYSEVFEVLNYTEKKIDDLINM